jgi:hypothetical protein
MQTVACLLPAYHHVTDNQSTDVSDAQQLQWHAYNHAYASLHEQLTVAAAVVRTGAGTHC